MNSSPPVIAIDGPSASGKGTIARKLAAHFGFAHLDTGLLYRAVGMAVLRAGGDPADINYAKPAASLLEKALMNAPDGAPPSLTLPARGRESSALAVIDFHKLWKDEALRSDEASVAASKAAAIPAVREALLRFQKDFCARPPENKPGSVLDGRDIGTVIAPDAPVKIFVTASAEARSLRRFKELQSRTIATTYETVLADMQARDARDAERAVAPTKPAADAVLLDTTDLTAEQAFAEALKIAQNRL